MNEQLHDINISTDEERNTVALEQGHYDEDAGTDIQRIVVHIEQINTVCKLLQVGKKELEAEAQTSPGDR